VRISSKSSRPLPSTDSALEAIGDPFGRMPCSRRRRSSSGKARRSVPPEDIEGHVTGGPRHAEQLVELWSAGLVGRNHLAVDYRFVDIESSTAATWSPSASKRLKTLPLREIKRQPPCSR